MKFVPVIAREMRAQARQPFTYWLRIIGVGLLLLGGWWFVNQRTLAPNNGGELFGQMHLLTYCAMWLLVPLGAADCISRERREGTLGLLFLTPLKPPHIVIAKGLVHGLRAATLVVAIIPVLTIPFLLGGVSWGQAILSLVMYFNAACWALAAALAASSLCRHLNRAMALAALLACGGFLAFPWAVGALLGINSQSTWSGGYSQSTYDFFAGFSVVAAPGNFNYLFRFLKLSQLRFAVGLASAGSFSILVLAIIFAANRIRRAWRDEPASARAQRWERTFFRPVIWTGLLQRWMRHLLDRNPIGWLERRQWSGRMITWAWFAVIISLYSIALTDSNFLRNSGGIQQIVAMLLAFSMAVTAAGSLRRERETGVLELLLVSPLTSRQIIHGRLRGLWGQFLPSVVTLLGLRIYFYSLYYDIFHSAERGELAEVWYYLGSYLVIPVVGLYFSLSSRHIISALVATLAFVFVIPAALYAGCQLLVWADDPGRSVALLQNSQSAQWVFQGVIAIYLYRRLRRKLEERSFALESPPGG